MTTVTIDERGVPTVEIEDSLDSGDEYRVTCVPGSRGDIWRCECESFRFRKGKHAPAGCKHTTAAKGLRILARMFEPERATAGGA